MFRVRFRLWFWVDNSYGIMCYRLNKLEEILIMIYKLYSISIGYFCKNINIGYYV